MAESDDKIEVTRSTRDPEALKAKLASWMVDSLGVDARPEVLWLDIPENNGMSSETVLFEAAWEDGGHRTQRNLVARIAPDMSDIPIFPTYDLEAQFNLMAQLACHSAVPVPEVLWYEPGSAAIGAPFFVMARIDGRVPPDLMPYTMESWVLEADEADRAAMQEQSVRLMADLHSVPTDSFDTTFLDLDVPGDTPLQRHIENQRRYYEWMREGRTFPLIEDAFAWLERNFPVDEGDTVITWGDSRIGNIIYDGFTPVAALDWEMAALGPRGLDIAWMSFMHRFFDDIARQFEMDGLPDFLRLEDITSTYREMTGVEVGDLRWYEAYAGLRHAIVMVRVHARRVNFGEAVWPENLDEAVMHHEALRGLIS